LNGLFQNTIRGGLFGGGKVVVLRVVLVVALVVVLGVVLGVVLVVVSRVGCIFNVMLGKSCVFLGG